MHNMSFRVDVKKENPPATFIQNSKTRMSMITTVWSKNTQQWAIITFQQLTFLRLVELY